MIITCEKCSTRFNLDDSLLRPEGSKVRCSQCRHVFMAFPENRSVPESAPEAAAPPEPETLGIEAVPDDDPAPDSPGAPDKPPEDREASIEFEDIAFDEDDISFDTEDDLDFKAPEFDDQDFDTPEEIVFEEPLLEIGDSDFPDLDIEAGETDAPKDDLEPGDKKTSVDDGYDAGHPIETGSPVGEAAPAPKAADPDFGKDGIEFEVDEPDLDAENEDSQEAFDEIDFEDLDPARETEAGLPGDTDDIPDLAFSLEDDPEADLVFEEGPATEAFPDFEMESPEDSPGPEASSPSETDFSFDASAETGAPPEDRPAFDESGPGFQAELDAEPEADKFAGYDEVLNQAVEPAAGHPESDDSPGDIPDTAPEAQGPVPETGPETEIPPQSLSDAPLVTPPPSQDIRKKRARKHQSAISAPVKVLLLLFILVFAAYAASLRFQYPIPFLSNIRIPYLTEMFQPEPPPKPVLKPAPNEVSIKGSFLNNATAGEIFIVTGKVDNPSNVAYSHIRVKGTLITKDAPKAMTQIVYCGNIIPEKTLQSGNISDIQKKLTVREGMHNANVNIGPGNSVRFMLVFSNLPENLTNFTVEVLDFRTSAGEN